VSVTGRDELADLGRVFNNTARRLQDLYATLQQSEDRLRLVIDTIPAHVWSTRRDGSVDFINRRWLETTGLTMQDALGWDWAPSFIPMISPGTSVIGALPRRGKRWRAKCGCDARRGISLVAHPQRAPSRQAGTSLNGMAPRSTSRTATAPKMPAAQRGVLGRSAAIEQTGSFQLVRF